MKHTFDNREITLRYRYVDDVLVIYENPNNNEHNSILDISNNLPENLAFTRQLENSRQINFLYVNIKTNNNIETYVFRKNNIIRKRSNHPLPRYNSLLLHISLHRAYLLLAYAKFK